MNFQICAEPAAIASMLLLVVAHTMCIKTQIAHTSF